MLSENGNECKPLVLGFHGHSTRRHDDTLAPHRGDLRRRHGPAPHLRGEVVQVDPIRPPLKAPGTKRLKLQYDESPSNMAFKINSCHYYVDGVRVASDVADAAYTLAGDFTLGGTAPVGPVR